MARTGRQRRRHALRRALWVGVPGGVFVAVVAVVSLVLTAPGVAVAGAPVGLVTQGIAEQNIAARLAGAHIRIGGAVLTGSELGASVDAHALARHAIVAHPLWNVTAWNPKPESGIVRLDPAVAVPALRSAAPQLFRDPVNAEVAFDRKASAFAVVPARAGVGVDLDDLAARLSAALTSGAASVSVTPTQAMAEAPATTSKAQAFADRLNRQAAAAGFYVSGERVESLPLATLASWFSVTADEATGDFAIRPVPAAVNAAVDGIAARVDRKPQNETVVTNSVGARLRVIQQGRAGVTLAESDAAMAVTAALAKGEFRFNLHGELAPFTTTTLFRRIEVDKSAGTTSLYEGAAPGKEKVVATYPVAIGTGGTHETRDGHFTIYTQLASQDMGDCHGNHGFGYCTKNVPWVSYFNGDQGFHGTYWHHNFGAGARMSHGCVNMRIPDALALYRFAQIGTEVWVHD